MTVTPGATEALYCAITATVTPGDEVIVFDPAYDSYDPAIELAGGTAVHLPLQAEDFSIDWHRVSAAINSRTRLLIINNPHNPTGAVLRRADLQALSTLLVEHDLLVLADEVYEHMVFDGQRHESLLRYPELADRCLCVSSFGKTYHATGWKIGYCIAPPALTAETRRRFISLCTFCSGYAIAIGPGRLSGLRLPRALPRTAGFYQHKRDRFWHQMDKSRFILRPSAGSFFQIADYSNISELDDWIALAGSPASMAWAVFRYRYFPPSRTGRAKYVRFCFAKENDTLEAAAERLCAI